MVCFLAKKEKLRLERQRGGLGNNNTNSKANHNAVGQPKKWPLRH